MSAKAVRRFLVTSTYFLYGLGTFLVVVACSSLAYTPKFSYTTEIDLNEQLNGTLNGVDVTNLEKIRLGNWGACYFTSQSETGSGICQAPAIIYKLTFINTMPGSISTTVIVPLELSVLLAFDIAALLPTALTLCYQSYPPCFRVEGTAIVAILIAGGLNAIFFGIVRNAMHSFGEGVVTNPGTAFSYLGFAALSVVCGYIFRKYLLKHDAAEKSKKPGGKIDVDYTVDREDAQDLRDATIADAKDISDLKKKAGKDAAAASAARVTGWRDLFK